jgi:hypothetical protein
MRSLWLSRNIRDEQNLISKCKSLICIKLPNMFDSNQKVLSNLQQPLGNVFESFALENADSILSDLNIAPGFVRYNIARWLKASILEYVVYAQAYFSF